MKRIKTLLVLAILVFSVVAGWKAGSCEVEYMALQADMLDLSKSVNSYSNYSTPRSDDDFRQAVIRKAQDHDILLEPSEVTVRRNGSGATSTMYLAADYSVPVDVLGYSFVMHFTPTSEKKLF
jgi:hypothetical protein